MTLKMDTLLADGVTIVACSGRIVFGEESSGLRESLKSLLTTTKKVVLNLSGVSYIDSGGLGTLVGVYSSARAAGADIKLTGLGQRLRDVLAITKLATVFEVYDTDQDAIAAFKSGSCTGGRDKDDLPPARRLGARVSLAGGCRPFPLGLIPVIIMESLQRSVAPYVVPPHFWHHVGSWFGGLSLTDLRAGQ